MTRLHQWRGRLQDQEEGYPFINGPAFVDRNTGLPVVPHVDHPSPFKALEALVAPGAGDAYDVTFTGTLTGPANIAVFIGYQDAAGNQLWAGRKTPAPFETAEQEAVIAAAMAVLINTLPDFSGTSVDNVLTIAPKAGLTIDAVSVTFGN